VCIGNPIGFFRDASAREFIGARIEKVVYEHTRSVLKDILTAVHREECEEALP
jgi:hypothetical protein